MGRPREFDVDTAIVEARAVLWGRGYAATTTEDLRKAMGIGRQSFYDTFGGKRDVFLSALEGYLNARFGEAERIIQGATSPLAGIERLFATLTGEKAAERARGCFGVASVCELGSDDLDVQRITGMAQAATVKLLAHTLAKAVERGEIASTIDPQATALQLYATFVGLRVLSKGGATVDMMRTIVATTLGSLQRPPS